MNKYITTLVVLNIATLVWFGTFWKSWKDLGIFGNVLTVTILTSILGIVLAGFKKVKWLSIIALILPLLFVIALLVYVKILHGGWY